MGAVEIKKFWVKCDRRRPEGPLCLNSVNFETSRYWLLLGQHAFPYLDTLPDGFKRVQAAPEGFFVTDYDDDKKIPIYFCRHCAGELDE